MTQKYGRRFFFLSLSFFVLFSSLFSLFCFASPAIAADSEGTVIIRDNIGNYTHLDVLESRSYFLMNEGDVEKFKEGYELHLVGSGSGDNVLVELRNTDGPAPKYITSVMMKDGDYFYCSRLLNGEYYLVLSFKLDKSYLNSTGVISGFSMLNQYQDPYYFEKTDTGWFVKVTNSPNPILPDNPLPVKDNGSGPDISGGSSTMILILASVAAVLIIATLTFRKIIPKK
ncbi:hypothetical protein [Methanolapillus ohkumae]|uniref:S-layer family duplication domain-containing protein n=1 Tax=Methanolapillus ohkumae TaxID=3028298 RepID=A0AA96ZV82_9EURY|nr:hypothetical protein MsAm2_03370 [Methanosarcinaceae archaeon Am2]